MKQLSGRDIRIALITIVFGLGVAWGINTIKVEQHGKIIGTHTDCIGKAKDRILTIERDNKARDEQFDKLEILIEGLKTSIDAKSEKLETEFNLLDKRLILIEYNVKHSIHYGSAKEMEKMIKDIEDAQKQKKRVE